MVLVTGRAFEQACQSHGIGNEDVDVSSGGSADITQLPYKFRLFSVDGGHTRELTVNDLTVAASHLEEGGIIILDDITNLSVAPGYRRLFYLDELLSTTICTFFRRLQQSFHYARTLSRVVLRHTCPICRKRAGGNETVERAQFNTNPHKSKDSGKNQFKWSGYAFVWGDNTVDVTTATSEWTKSYFVVSLLVYYRIYQSSHYICGLRTPFNRAA